MKKLSLAFSLIAVCFAASACINTSKANKPRPPLTALADAPEFDLRNVQGGQFTSKDFKGKIMVVDFWATWCVPCKAEIPEYNELRAKMKDKGVEFLGVTFDSGSDIEDIKKHIKELEMQYPVALGSDAVDAGFGGHPGYPTTFLVGKDWKIYRKIFGGPPNKVHELEQDIEALLAKAAD